MLFLLKTIHPAAVQQHSCRGIPPVNLGTPIPSSTLSSASISVQGFPNPVAGGMQWAKQARMKESESWRKEVLQGAGKAATGGQQSTEERGDHVW